MVSQSIENVVKLQAISFTNQVRLVAKSAKKEEEIRTEVERQLALVAKEAGINLRGKHEFTIGTGRVDSVYGCVIIEYKNPNDTSSKLSADIEDRGNQEVIRQIKNRFLDFEKEQNRKLDSMLGIGCDGNYFIFVKYYKNKWYIKEPFEIDQRSVERFIWALINMGKKGKAYTPDNLAEDFGSEAVLAKDGLRTFYEILCKKSNGKGQMLFKQWKLHFGEVCGYDIDVPTDRIVKLSNHYGILDTDKPAELMFALHSYYALFIKLLAAEIVAFYHKLPSPVQRLLKANNSNKLKTEIEDLEKGSIFRHLNITNFLEGDFFCWYLYCWDTSIERIIGNIACKIDEYNPGTLSEDPEGSRDLLKKMYEQLFPKIVRHDLGEYYTPDWLAEHILNELRYSGNPEKKILDPACGSGTFIIAVINRVRNWYEKNRETCGYDEGDLLRKILSNVVGFDLNPLAVMTARTNYLISVRDLVSHVEKVEIPIYLCDSILTPSEYGGLDTFLTGQKKMSKELKTSVAKFIIPLEIVTSRENLAQYCELLESCVKQRYDSNEFIQRCRNEGLEITAEEMHEKLYKQLSKLDGKNQNGIWARIIKNAFAPIFCGKFDIVLGNPPWINWNNLPHEYRIDAEPIWRKYNLWPTYLLGASQDFSILFVYVCCDSYLKKGGKLGFVITQSIFKSKSGSLFRKFLLPKNTPISPLRVDDLTDFQPFEGATNRTATIILVKGKPTSYPVPYVYWRKKTDNTPSQDDSLVEVKKKIHFVNDLAVPVGTDETSPWLTDSPEVIGVLRNVIGKSSYSAVMGIHTYGANAVYFLDVIRKVNDSTSLVTNITHGAKRKVPKIETSVENSLLYPLLRGRDINRFLTMPNQKIIFPYTIDGKIIPETIMRIKYPKAYEYLKKHKSFLESRSEYRRRGGKGIWYCLYSTYDEVFAKWKVVWKEQASSLTAAVLCLSDNKIVIPDHKVMMVGVESEEEAHYLSALLNSSPAQVLIKGFTINTQITTKLLDFLRIEKYSPSNELHKKLTSLGKKGYTAAFTNDKQALSGIEEEIDFAASKIWGITMDQIASLQKTVAK